MQTSVIISLLIRNFCEGLPLKYLGLSQEKKKNQNDGWCWVHLVSCNILLATNLAFLFLILLNALVWLLENVNWALKIAKITVTLDMCAAHCSIWMNFYTISWGYIIFTLPELAVLTLPGRKKNSFRQKNSRNIFARCKHPLSIKVEKP